MEQLIREQHAQVTVQHGFLVAGAGLAVLIGSASLGSHIPDWFSRIAPLLMSILGG